MMDGVDQFGVGAVFQEYGEHLTAEGEVKEQLRGTTRELEVASRDVHSLLQRVHRPGGVLEATKLATLAKEKFSKVQELYKVLDSQLPAGTFWKYCQLWGSTTSWISFLASLTIYLETEALAKKEQVEELLGLNSTSTVRLDIEEYLMGLCHLSNELSRLTVNCVTSEDYSRPERIATFISTLHTGFRLLNLKNDNLRKKFDGIKYDLKKVEEVVYDLSIRGLNKSVGKQTEGDKEITDKLEESGDKDKASS